MGKVVILHEEIKQSSPDEPGTYWWELMDLFPDLMVYFNPYYISSLGEDRASVSGTIKTKEE